MSKRHYSDYDEATTARCERALVTVLGDIGPWSNRVYLAGGLVTGPHEVVHGERESFVGGFQVARSGPGIGSPKGIKTCVLVLWWAERFLIRRHHKVSFGTRRMRVLPGALPPFGAPWVGRPGSGAVRRVRRRRAGNRSTPMKTIGSWA